MADHRPRRVALIVTIEQYPDDKRTPDDVRRDVQVALQFQDDVEVVLAANSREV